MICLKPERHAIKKALPFENLVYYEMFETNGLKVEKENLIILNVGGAGLNEVMTTLDIAKLIEWLRIP